MPDPSEPSAAFDVLSEGWDPDEPSIFRHAHHSRVPGVVEVLPPVTDFDPPPPPCFEQRDDED